MPTDTQFLYGDPIGSTNLNSDGAGNLADQVAYTAFGEILDASGNPGGDPPEGFPRYQYAGFWGYESGGFGDDPASLGLDRHLLVLPGVNPALPPITLQHVGHRWYQPDIGRFIQRDPIGVMAGLNVYLYTGANPLSAVDADGRWWKWVWDGIRWVLRWVAGKTMARGKFRGPAPPPPRPKIAPRYNPYTGKYDVPGNFGHDWRNPFWRWDQIIENCIPLFWLPVLDPWDVGPRLGPYGPLGPGPGVIEV